MATVEEYKAKASQSAIDLDGATNERDRALHRRAISAWKQLIVNQTAADARASEPEAAPRKKK